MSISVKIVRPIKKDKLILVDVKKFMKYVNQEDLLNRDSEIIENQYHRNWFYKSNGYKYFVPSVVFIRQENGDILFINGRHRFMLLFRHLKKFPVAIAGIGNSNVGYSSDISLKTFDEIKIKTLKNDYSFLLPELGFGDFAKERGL